MKITFLSPSPDLSGGERVLAIYAAGLAAMGHGVEVVCTGPRRFSAWTRTKCLLTGKGWLPQRRVGASHYQQMGVPHRVVRRRPLVEGDLPDADVCVASWWETSTWLNAMGPAKGAKVYLMQDYGAPSQEWHKLEPTFRYPMKIVTISRWLYERILGVAPEADVALVPNGVDAEVFSFLDRPKNDPPVFGMVYRKLATKRCGLALGAFVAYRAAGGRGVLRLVGGEAPEPSPDDPPGLERLGRLDDAGLVTAYQGCDAWLFTSESEGFGLPILEAMACGTPVIAAPSGAAPELVPGGGGWLLEDIDAGRLAGAMHEVEALPGDTWVARSRAARAAAEGCDWPTATGRFEAALRAAADGRREA
ncbi:MAG: glycosyltransferase family 4 protein [Planctomycetota bacterium]